jgi:hypothetical protein
MFMGCFLYHWKISILSESGCPGFEDVQMLLITFLFVSGFKNIISLLNIYHFFLSKKIILYILSSVNILIGDNDDFVGFHSTQPTNKQ